ncbi:hypothetical protein LCGC14_2320260 [marine sediment metagenome]|uniref:Uncharacterized protein n=1 Tax=marine sediment metagenome TaxID=412755 RepID=A0A0F9D5J4_9ZZZZ
MSQRQLMPMDIVLYDVGLWVVSTAHNIDSQGRQLVNLARYKASGYKKDVSAYKCRIVQDAAERKEELCLYPDSDFD